MRESELNSGNHQLERDLLLASQLQSALLPSFCPECMNHRMYARNRMCDGVGGDFHDFIPLNEEQFAIVIGDVVGHGVRASLMMARIMGFLRAEVSRLGRPVEIIRALNTMMIDLGQSVGNILPCSLIYGVVDVPSGTSFFVNAGHPHPLLYNRDREGPHFLGGTDLLLGVEDFDPTELCHSFTAGERLVLYSDGITEATNAENEFFGNERFMDILKNTLDASPEECTAEVLGAVDEFRGDTPRKDDETIVVIDRIQE